MERILESERIPGKLVNPVMLVRYSKEENTCEQPTNITHCDKVISEFHQLYPNKLSLNNTLLTVASQKH